MQFASVGKMPHPQNQHIVV